MKRWVSVLVVMALFVPLEASAKDHWPVNGVVLKSPNAPVVLQSCAFSPVYVSTVAFKGTIYSYRSPNAKPKPNGVWFSFSNFATWAKVANRNPYDLLSVTVNYWFYDLSNSLMRSGLAITYKPDSALPPNYEINYVQPFGDNIHALSLNEPWSGFGHIACRVERATFTDHKTWAYGKPWRWKLFPLRGAYPKFVPGGPSSP